MIQVGIKLQINVGQNGGQGEHLSALGHAQCKQVEPILLQQYCLHLETLKFEEKKIKIYSKFFMLISCCWFTWVVWTRYSTIWSNQMNWVGAARPTGAQNFRLWAESAVGVWRIVPATRWPWAGRPVVPNTFFPHSIACLDRFRHAAIPFHSKSLIDYKFCSF